MMLLLSSLLRVPWVQPLMIIAMPQQQVDKVTANLDEQIKNNTTLMAENSQKHMELRLKDEEIEAQKQEIIKVNKVSTHLVFL